VDLREALAATSLASLEWDENREKAVDRVAASGKASSLGVNLWKARYMLESPAYKMAIKGLIEHYRARYVSEDIGIAQMVVEQVLSEYLASFCSTCNGSRELIINELKVTCDTCRGSGLKRYSDLERAGMMKMSLQRVKSLTRKMQWLMGEISSMDRAVNMVLMSELRDR
jgi:hypothetical protein